MYTILKQKKTSWGVLLLTILAFLLITGLALAQAGLPTIDRWLIGGGGANISGGAIQINASVGQPITGQSSAGTVSLSAGFWPGAMGNNQSHIFLPAVVK